MGLQQELLGEHEHVEKLLEQMKEAVRWEDSRSLCAIWRRFERELVDHMAYEERELLPGFARFDPKEAKALLAEHAELRRMLEELGMSVDLHALRAEASDQFMEKLRAHAQRENRILYPWAATQHFELEPRRQAIGP